MAKFPPINAVIASLCFLPACFHLSEAATYDVIVIGAGMSGLSAASTLKSEGVKNIVVLEARNRTGGRTYTLQTTVNGAAMPIDLGASWIHGIKSNPLVSLANSAGVKLASKTTNYDNGLLFNGATGKEVSSANEDKYNNLWDQWEDFLDEVRDRDYDEEDPGLQSAVNEFIKKKKLTGETLRAFQYLLNVSIEHEYAGSISQLSLWYDEDSELPGGDKLVLGGYQRVTEYVGRGVNVLLKHQVTNIDYFKSGNVVVKAKVGSTAKTFSAKKVIVTLPIGVLKAGVVKFNPALPSKNQKAINAMGAGLLNKCILVFKTAFWGSKIEFIERIAENGNGAFEEFMSLIPATGKPVLYAFNAATYAESLEKKNDAQTVATAMAALRKIWPNAPEPEKYFISRWKSDPYARGSYSFTTPKMEFDQVHKNVALPVGGGRIHFAGEHTNMKYPATVHGAYYSGKDAACAVLKELGKKC